MTNRLCSDVGPGGPPRKIEHHVLHSQQISLSLSLFVKFAAAVCRDFYRFNSLTGMGLMEKYCSLNQSSAVSRKFRVGSRTRC